MSIQKIQLAVVGAGPGGYVAAIRAAQLGQSVTVFDPGPLGGVCLNWGCIPSKALLHQAKTYQQLNKAAMASGYMGLKTQQVALDLNETQQWKNTVVGQLTGGIAQLFKAHGIHVIPHAVGFVNPTTLDAGPAGLFQAESIILATGSRPIALSDFPVDHQTIWDSTDALAATILPKSMAIVGGGVIGVELASLYAMWGVPVQLVELGPTLIPGIDADVVAVLQKSLKAAGVDVQLNTTATPEQLKAAGAEVVVVAVGRKPNTNALSLKNAGLVPDAKGYLSITPTCQTTQPHIYAIGDITPGPQLAHRASHQAVVAAEHSAGKPAALDYRAMPSAIFSQPEIATVGLSEAEAKSQQRAVCIGKFPFAANGRSISGGHTVGFVKLIADAQTDCLLGAQLVGPEVSELLAALTLAIELGATATDVSLTIHAHPTLSEAVCEASEAIHQRAIHMFQPRA